jgi:thioredoxin-dependent peroxiredoxin
MLSIGDKAPLFKTINQDGKAFDLEKKRGKKLVLFFYPKDLTPTCTVQACNLRDNYAKLKKQGFAVYGISVDGQKSHKRFQERNQLPYDLLVDESHEIVEKYGVWAEKSMFGNKYMGIIRTTFLIDEHGIIMDIISKVKSKEHSNQILK